MREPVVHQLKTWPTYWDAVARGEKSFEVRKNDRAFQTGDIVVLSRQTRDEFGAPYDTDYTTDTVRSLTFRIGWILQGGQFGIEPGYCIFSLAREGNGNG